MSELVIEDLLVAALKEARDDGTPVKLRPSTVTAILAELRDRRSRDLTLDEVEALVHTIDDVTRMASLDDDGGPKTEVVRKRAIATLRRLTGTSITTTPEETL